MGYDRMVLFVLVAGLLVCWSELLQASHQKKGFKMKGCKGRPQKGNCEPGVERYYYNKRQKTCKPVIYTGCDYSDNIFVSLKSCISKCHLYVEMDQEEYQPGTLPIRCIFPKYSGKCKAAFPNYYYDTTTKKCEEFIFGGCGANPNNFGTIEECVKECECSGEGCQITAKVEALLADMSE